MPNEKPTTEQQDRINIPMSTLHTLPDVFRIAVDDKSLGPLVMSIQTKGVLKPILARIREDGECEIIDGYRRKRAAELAGLKVIPVQPVTESPERARTLFLMTHGQLSPEKGGKTVEDIIADERSKLNSKPKPAEKKAEAPKAERPDEKMNAPEKLAQAEPKKPDSVAKDAEAKKTRVTIDPNAPKKEIPIEKPAAAVKPDPGTVKKAAPAGDKDEAKKAAEKPDAAKKPEAADAKTVDKTEDKKTAPTADKTTAPKPEDKTTATKPEEKKPEAAKAADPAKPAEKKADTPPADKAGDKPKAPEKPDDKPKQTAAPADKDKVAAKPASYAEGPTGTTITKVLGEKLNPPDEKALASLPLPKEGEAFAVVLHPAYLKKAEFNHFSVDRDSDDFKELFKSIQMFGVKDPVLTRPGKDGTLEILSGQRRHLIASELNYPVPTIIQRMDDDDARILVADGNLHREKISTYDQSRALRMKMDSMKRKAGRRKTGIAASGKTDEALAADMGISTAKLRRLMRLSDANREVCNMIDDGKLTLSVASAISQLKPANQTKLSDLIDIGLKPSADQVERMRKAEASGKLTEKAMRDIIDNKDIEPKKPAPVTPPPASAPTPAPAPAPVASAPTASTPAAATPSMAPAPSSIPKSPDVAAPSAPAAVPAPSATTPAAPTATAPNVVPFSAVTAHNNAESAAPSKPAEDDPFVGKQERPENTKVVLSGDRLRKYFPDVNMTPREIEDKVYEAIDFYQKYQEKQKQKAAIFDKNKGKGGSAR